VKIATSPFSLPSLVNSPLASTYRDFCIILNSLPHPNAIRDSLPIAFIPTNKRFETVFSHSILIKHRLLVAYLLGYTTTTTPRIASICARYIAKRLKQRSVESPKNEDSISSERELGRRLLAAVKGGIRFDGFAMVCGITLLSS